MIRFIAIIVGSGILGIFLLVKLLGGNDGPAYVPVPINLAPQVIDTSFEDARRLRAQTIEKQVRSRFQDAPDYVIDLGVKISNPDVSLTTYSDDILALSSEDINKSWGQTHPDSNPDFAHTLLREAVISGNTGAAALLLDRGASVEYNQNEMPFQASSLVFDKREYNLWFPDYRTGSKFLRMWLDRGGDPNVTHPLYGNGIGRLLNHVPIYNLESTLALLDAGADPWSPFEVRAEDGAFLYEQPSYFKTLATANKIQAEVSFRIALEGHYKNGPKEEVEDLVRTYERLAAAYVDAKTKVELETAWTLKRSMGMIYEEMNQTPGPKTQNLINRRIQDNIGGFFLAPDEIRSPNSFDQRVSNREEQFGDEKWAK